MNTIKKYLLVAVIGLLAVGCVTDFNAVIPDADKDLLVFNGDIVSDVPFTITIRRTVPLHGSLEKLGTFKEVAGMFGGTSNMDMYIVCSDGTETRGDLNMEKGGYTFYLGRLKSAETYHMRFVAGNEVYESIPSKPYDSGPIEDLTYQLSEDSTQISICVSTPPTDDIVYYQWDTDEDWSIVYAYIRNCWGNLSRTGLFSSNAATPDGALSNYVLYRFPINDKRFSDMYRIKVVQRVISPEAYEYLNASKKLNESIGSLFSPQPFDLKGNISSKTSAKNAIGFIQVVGQRQLDVLYVSRLNANYKEQYISCPVEVADGTDEEMQRKGYVKYMTGDLWTGFWTTMRCGQCEYYGGNSEAPSDWSPKY